MNNILKSSNVNDGNSFIFNSQPKINQKRIKEN